MTLRIFSAAILALVWINSAVAQVRPLRAEAIEYMIKAWHEMKRECDAKPDRFACYDRERYNHMALVERSLSREGWCYTREDDWHHCAPLRRTLNGNVVFDDMNTEMRRLRQSRAAYR
jgi:hypothetical protein